VDGDDAATITRPGAFASYGEPDRLIREAGGEVEAVMLAGGRLVREAELAAELTGKVREPLS
jgi:hypothetical protein